jgi:translation initiation factor IF-2
MAAGIHGSARTTPRVRAELQASQATTRGLAARYGLDPKTVAKWRSRSSTADARMGPARPRSTVLTEAEEAIVVGFRVAPEDRAVALADEKKIDIRRYDIIYQVTDEIKKAVEGMLVPEVKEVHLGRANVRQVFKISKVGTVAGCFVTQGTIERAAKARLIREGREIYKGSIEALKRFKDDVKEVREGFECGIKIANYDDLKTDDMIEAYRIDVIRRTL